MLANEALPVAYASFASKLAPTEDIVTVAEAQLTGISSHLSVRLAGFADGVVSGSKPTQRVGVAGFGSAL